MANPDDLDVKVVAATKPADEPHMRNMPRPGKHKHGARQGSNKPSVIEPVELPGSAPKPIGLLAPNTAPVTRPTLADGVIPSTGVAHLTGQSLRFPMGTKITAGEIVVVGRKPFEVRKDKTLTFAFAAKGVGLLALTVFALVGVVSVFTGPSGGPVTGVVVDRVSGRIIPDATVTFEGGPAVTTNLAGLYMAEGLRSGLFKVTASAPGYEPQTGSVVRPSDAGAQLAFALMPLGMPAVVLPAPGSAQAGAPSQETDSEADAAALAYGNISLETDFNDFLVFVDGVLYGKDAKKIKRMSAGDHRVVLQLEGFEDYSKDVAVKARSTQTMQVAKADLTPKVDPVKRAKAFFAEAKDLFDRGLYPQAIDRYDTGLKEDPQNASALQYRGWAHFKAGNVDAARADLSRAAILHAEVNRYLDAVACAGYLIEMSPTDPEGYTRRAGYYTQMREYDKAIKDCETAVKLDKKSAKPQLTLAETCFAAGDYKRAAKEFDKARKLSDKPVDVYVQMLISLAKGGEDEQVRKRFKDFTELATPEMQKKLRGDPEWLRVLQIVDPKMRSEG